MPLCVPLCSLWPPSESGPKGLCVGGSSIDEGSCVFAEREEILSQFSAESVRGVDALARSSVMVNTGKGNIPEQEIAAHEEARKRDEPVLRKHADEVLEYMNLETAVAG